MTRTFWMAVILLAFLPAVTLVFGGESFPSAPASVTFTPTVHTGEHVDDKLVQMVDEMGPVPVPVVILSEDGEVLNELPEGPCAGRGSESEGEARTALPDPWTTRIGWLQDTWTEFQRACKRGKTNEVDRVIDERNGYRRELKPACSRMSVTSRPDEFNLLCAEWRC